MSDDWQWLLSDTHTDWVNWYWVIVCELQLVSYVLIMRFNTHTTNNHAVIHFTCFWWSGIVSSSSWPKLSRFYTLSFCLDLVSEPKDFFVLLWTNQKTCSEIIASHNGVNWFNKRRNRNVFVSAQLPLSRGCKNAITIGQCVFYVNKYHKTFVGNIA